MALAFKDFDPAQGHDGSAFLVTAEDAGHHVAFRVQKLIFADVLGIKGDVFAEFLKRQPQVMNACELAYSRWRKAHVGKLPDEPVIVLPDDLKTATA